MVFLTSKKELLGELECTELLEGKRLGWIGVGDDTVSRGRMGRIGEEGNTDSRGESRWISH